MRKSSLFAALLGCAALSACTRASDSSSNAAAAIGGGGGAPFDAGIATGSSAGRALPPNDASDVDAARTPSPTDASSPTDTSTPADASSTADAAVCTYSAPTGVSSAPPFVGADDLEPSAGAGLIRRGPLLKVPGLVYAADPLTQFRVPRGFVNPACQTGLLSNPYRADGTALNAGYAIPANFSGHVPVFTEGNWWPFIGAHQPQPPHGNLQADSGIYLVDGSVAVTERPLLVPGEMAVTIRNRTPYGILVSSGSYPGDEQPGQVMTPILPDRTVPMPIPPKGWYPDGSGNPRVPEVYVSVAGLDPMDAVGWHVSNTVPDYGTPGFAYTIGGKFTNISGQPEPYLFIGFNRNEGYDPILSADPGYGMELYVQLAGEARMLVAITDIVSTGTRSARQDLWAAPRFNPGVNAQGGLSAFPNGPEGTTFELELVTHAVAQAALQLLGPAVLHSADSL